MSRLKVYSWRFKRDIVLVTKAEYAAIDAALERMYMGLRAGDLEGLPTDERFQRHPAGQEALAIYKTITGVSFEGSAAELRYAVESNYARLCPACEKPFRSGRARFCAACGYTLPEGETAGPLNLE